MARQRIETAPEITIYDESFVIKAASGASAPLAEFKNSSGTVVGNIATTGTLNVTSVTSGNVVPSTSNTYSLGAVNNVWKDIFVGPGSLYVNGQKVLQDESGVIIVSATINNNLGLRTSGSGDIELDPTGTGVVSIKGPLVIQAGTNITSADGNAVTFGGAINTDTISSKTTNTDLSITANGTGKVYINDNSEVSGNLVVGGNLTVSGTTTTVNSETISLADNLIDLNSNFTTGSPTEDAGVRIMRGDSAAVQLRWNEGSDVWEFTNNGSTYNTITPLASPTFTGTVTIPSGASISGFAPLASPALTGTPTAPTAAALTNTTQVATTAFVSAAVTAGVATVDTLDDLTDVTITSVTSGQFLKWNGTAWINSAVPVINDIDDITGVTITAAADKDFLMYNGTAWVDSPITLGTDTTGGYVATLTAGTGITLANNSGEGASPTVTVDTTVIQAKVANVTDTEIGYLDGVTSAIQTQIDTKAPIASPTFTGTVTIPSGASISGFATLASPTFTGTVTVPAPTNATDAVTKSYADAITQSLDIKDSVRVASTANITIASALTNGSTIDGVVVATGNRVLLKNQTTTSQNGVYVVVASGAASRSTDADTSAKVTTGMYVFVSEGTASADMGYVLTTNDAITLGTTALSFTQFSGAGQITAGTGITKTGNELSVDIALDEINNVDAGSPSVDDVLKWDGSNWVNGAVGGGSWTTALNQGVIDGGPKVTSLVADNSSMGIYADSVYFIPNSGGTLEPGGSMPNGYNGLGWMNNGYFLTDYWIPSASVPSPNSNNTGISAHQIVTRSIGIGYNNGMLGEFVPSSFYIAANGNDGLFQDVKIFSVGEFGIQPNTTFDGNVTISGNLTVAGVAVDFSSDQSVLASSIFG